MDKLEGREQSVGDRVRQAAREAGIGPSDPLGPLIDALAKLPESFERAAERAESSIEQLAKAQMFSDAQVQQVARRLMVMTDRLSTIRLTRFVVSGTVALFVAVGIGIGLDRWWHRDDPTQPIVAGITGGTPRCDPPRPDGSKLCWIPVFEVPPATR